MYVYINLTLKKEKKNINNFSTKTSVGAVLDFVLPKFKFVFQRHELVKVSKILQGYAHFRKVFDSGLHIL